MAEDIKIDAEASAEKAYAAAAEFVSARPAASAKDVPVIEAVKPEVEFPSKAKRAIKGEVEGPAGAAPVAPTPAKAIPVANAKKGVKKAKAVAVKPPAVVRKPKPAAKPVAAVKPKSLASAAKAAIQPKAAPKTVAPTKTVFQQIKDKTMNTTEFTTKIKDAVADTQGKAKEAFAKGAATFGEYNEFAKGNLEAVVESGKILAAGVQSLGSVAVADTKANFETLTAEVKELTSVKSPLDFLKLQVEFARRNFDIAVAQTSKNSEAVLKLVNEAAAPISGRVNLAVEKVKKAA